MQFYNLEIQFKRLSRIPLLSLVLLGLAYILVGWQLSLNDIFGFIGVVTFIIFISVALDSNPWLDGVLGYFPQIILFSASTSLLITLTLIFPMILVLVIIPTLTTFLAWKELEFLDFDQDNIRRILLVVAGLGLAVGEFVDLAVLPSVKY